jgi:hypothetical protein
MRSDQQKERRRHPRKPLGGKVQLLSPGAAIPSTVPCSRHSLSHDISATGMRIESDRFYLRNTQLLLSIERESAGRLSITSCAAVVVWANPLPGQGRCMLGIRFSKNSKDD